MSGKGGFGQALEEVVAEVYRQLRELGGARDAERLVEAAEKHRAGIAELAVNQLAHRGGHRVRVRAGAGLRLIHHRHGGAAGREIDGHALRVRVRQVLVAAEWRGAGEACAAGIVGEQLCRGKSRRRGRGRVLAPDVAGDIPQAADVVRHPSSRGSAVLGGGT